MRLLLAEDERELSAALQAVLKRNHYEVDAVYDGGEAYDYLQTGNYDGFILDVMMPVMDGFTLLKKIRNERNNVPVLMLTARAEVDDRVQGLDLGADDYLTKPFHLAELNARIKSVIRRKQQDGELQLSLANLTIYPDKHSVYINGKEIVLNRKEFDLLYYFISNPNRLISKATLAESVWGDYIDQADNFDFIYSQVKNLRKKLKAAGAIPEIKAVYGFGYKMTDEE